MQSPLPTASSGQSTVEYLLVLSLVVATTTTFNALITSSINTSLAAFASQLEADLQTGMLSKQEWTQ
jgi:hypothetical protein